MSLYLVLRFLHIVATIAFVGGLLARQVVRGLAARTDEVRRFADLNAAAGRIETTLVIPGNLAVIVVGVVLALHTGAPILGFLQGAERNWLLASNGLLVLGMLTVPLVFVPRGKRFGVVLERALAEGMFTPELRAAVSDPVVRTVHTLELTLVFVIVYLMVFRPF